MIENELIRIWQSSPEHEQVKFEKSKLMLEVQRRLNSFKKGVVIRDWMEIGTGIIMIPIFAFQVFNQPNLLAKFGALWIVGYIVFVIYKLRKAKKSEPLPKASYIDYLKESKVYLETQLRLIDSVLSWYILPGLIGVLIMHIGILDLFNKSWETILNTPMFWVGLIAISTVGLLAYFLNKWTVKKEYKPRLEKVNELLRLLQEE